MPLATASLFCRLWVGMGGCVYTYVYLDPTYKRAHISTKLYGVFLDSAAVNGRLLLTPFCNSSNCYNILYSFRCQCAAGFTGTHCELNVNECQSNPCKNQATCVDELNSYSCKCQPGFSGSRCETGICELHVVKNDTRYSDNNINFYLH